MLDELDFVVIICV